ncbi:DUF4279 domain-containing protein [Massilia sp. IC2-476]|uniref:DUF4279 domain-containing protein n=1 Tax=Massilia sp. IC2-476 TaxID=2887199 RepID=UPI001D10776E|nr:DUF4279 domain-containing protein [Massilia sp. IC2-476]MCC2972577.1 DUF4279 domain-containing protein [Massilia sp. IC2-476]
MAGLNRCQAALRLFGDDLVPDELSGVFGHRPTKGWVKGDEHLSSSGALIVKKTGAWILEAEATESADFNRQVSRVLACVDVGLVVWAALATRFEIDLFCGWFMQESNEGVDISPKTMRMLGERHIGLTVDIYAAPEDGASG